MQVGGENATVRVALALTGLQQHSARAIAEQHAGGAVLPVQDAGIDFRADHQNAPRLSEADHAVGHRQAVDEARTGGGEVEAKPFGHAEGGLDAQRRGGKSLIGGAGGHNDDVNVVRPGSGIVQRGLGRLGAHECSGFVRAGQIALADARALADPLVGCVDPGREFVVGDDPLGKIAAYAGEDGTKRHL